MLFKNIFKKRYIFISIFFIIFIYTIISTSFIYNKNYWKKFLLDKTEEIIGFNLTYDDVDLFIFPSPGILIKNISIQNKNNLSSIELSSRESKVIFSLHNIVHGKWKIDSLTLEDGKFTLNLFGLENKSSTGSEFFKLSSLQILEINLIKIDTSINYNNVNESFFIDLLRFNHNSSMNNQLDLDLKYGGGNIKANLSLGINSSIFDSKNIYLDGHLFLERFPIKIFNNYYSIFKNQKFYNSRVSGDFSFHKEDEYSIDSKLNLTISDLNFKDIESSPPISLKGKTTFEINSKRVIFKNLSVQQPGRLSAIIDGELIARKNIFLNLDINSSYCELEKSLQYILSFLDTVPTSKTSPNFSSEMKFSFNKLFYKDYNFDETQAELTINNSIIKLNISRANLFDGSLKGDGIIKIEDSNSYDFSFQIEKMNVEKCIQKFTEKKYLTGLLNSEFHLHSSGTTPKEFENNLKVRGFISVKSGSLRGYANFLKPLLELGKLVNFLGPKGNSGEFQSLETNFFLEKRTIEIPDLKMTGVGIDASGRGKVDFDNNIDFRIVVGLGGFAGKAFAVPILYSGIFEKNFAFIDPIWLGSVYFGITVAGPVTGGIAGSIATEYIHSTYQKIKRIFDF